jgi:uncharacterized membrane protein
MPPASSPALERQRWDVIDLARGIAILAMIVYHFGWDLSFLDLIETNILALPSWRWFARIIAGSFLFLSGIGLVLAHARGVRWRAFWRRFGIVGGAALLVTGATYLAFPQSFIFFGILHCIALSSLLALPFLRAPVWLTLVAAIVVLAAPLVLTSRAFDGPLLDWLGLGSLDPVTNDYVPIFPWFGLVLLGTVFARLVMTGKTARFFAQWRTSGVVAAWVIWAGRHSLPIYLLHQVVLLSILYGVLLLAGPNANAEARPFIAECEASCRRENAQASTCRAICSCAVDSLRNGGLWPKVLANDIEAEDRLRISRLTQQCLRQTPQAVP